MASEPEEAKSLVAEIAERSDSARFSETIQGVVIGTVTRVDVDGTVWVDFAGNPRDEPILARSTVAIEPGEASREVALSFERGRVDAPIVLGLIAIPPQRSVAIGAESESEPMVIELDRDVEVRVGRASVTLTRAGAIELRGEYILSRAEGTQRILGGTVRIN